MQVVDWNGFNSRLMAAEVRDTKGNLLYVSETRAASCKVNVPTSTSTCLLLIRSISGKKKKLNYNTISVIPDFTPD